MDRDSESLGLLSPSLYVNQRDRHMKNFPFYAQSHSLVPVTILCSLARFLLRFFCLPQSLQLYPQTVFMNFLPLHVCMACWNICDNEWHAIKHFLLTRQKEIEVLDENSVQTWGGKQRRCIEFKTKLLASEMFNIVFTVFPIILYLSSGESLFFFFFLAEIKTAKDNIRFFFFLGWLMNQT